MSLHRLLSLIESAVVRLTLERGQTMAEYGILVAVIAVVVVLAATLLGTNASKVISSTAVRL